MRYSAVMVRRVDPRYSNNLIDAHVLDRTGGPEDAVVDEILALADDGKFCVMLPYSVQSEIQHPNTPKDVKQRAAELLFTGRVQLTADEGEQHRKVREILQGDAKPGKHDSDAFHVVEASKYGGYFITNDQRILRKASAIRHVVSIEIVTPTKFLEMYRECEREYPK